MSTNLWTTKSVISISSLPLNCSQPEHVAFWHGRAAVPLVCGAFCGRGEGAAGVLPPPLPPKRFGPVGSRAMTHRDSVFPAFLIQCRNSSSPPLKSDGTHQSLSKEDCVCAQVWKSVVVASRISRIQCFFGVKVNMSRDWDWLKGRFALGPHNEVSITETTKEMFF